MKSFADLEDPLNGHDRARTQSNDPLLTWKYDKISTSIPSPRSLLSNTRIRRLFLLALAATSIFLLVAVSSVTVLSPDHPAFRVASLSVTPEAVPTNVVDAPELVVQEPYTFSPYVKGPPTERFRDNLLNDTKYITSWISAGWTNDVMTYANLIYLGSITDRVPIIGVFTPSHIGGDAGTIAFGEVFDVPRFNRESGIHIIEWDEVKDPDSTEVEDIGCWNIWESVQYTEQHPRNSAVPGRVGLDISYTRAPAWVKLIPDYPHDAGSSFWAFARLGFPQERAKHLGTATPSPQHGVTLDPDEQVLCYDYLYYAWAQQPYEWELDYFPAWRYVTKYFRWTEGVEALTALYLRRAFGLSSTAEVPPYIAIHVRHGDFKNWCWEAEVPEDCFAPLPVIARRVREVQEELWHRKGIEIPAIRVVMTSDETDEAWWDEVNALGWQKIDHDVLRTAATYGRWYPVILDAAIQSNALGFVGTDRSTYSILSRRRVEDWHDGATRMVLWGRKGADDH